MSTPTNQHHRDERLDTNEDVWYHSIAAFLDPIKDKDVLVVCKGLLKTGEKTAESALCKIEQDHYVDAEWRARLEQDVTIRYQSHYFYDDMTPRPHTRTLPNGLPEPTHPSRLLLPSSPKVPLAQVMTPHIGPSVVLPDGNIAIACERDNMIRIFDTSQMSFTLTAETGARLPVHLRWSWISDSLFYSNGHLVLRSGFGPHSDKWVHVWKLEGEGDVHIQYSYSMRFASDNTVEVEDVVVAANGTMYILWKVSESAGYVRYLLKAFDVASGNTLTTRSIVPFHASGAKRPSSPHRIVSSLLISGNHLLLLRHVEENGPFPGIGQGVYTFSMTDDLKQTGFSPCFEEGEVYINHDKSKTTDKWLLYHNFGDESFRKISINADGLVEEEPRHITFGPRNRVMLATADRVFVEHPDEKGSVELDEYDVATGEKVRTICTGVQRDTTTMVASVLSNGKEVFCVVCPNGWSMENIVQSFLL